MKRYILPLIGLVELALGVAIALLGHSLPGTREVRLTFTAAEQVTAASGEQVRLLRDQVADLRRSNLSQASEHLRAANRTLTNTLQKSRVDFNGVRTIRDATGQAADGLDSLATALDPVALGQFGAGLGATADLLDQKVIPAAQSAARSLEVSSDSLRASAGQFAQLLKAAPLDLKPVHDLHEGLGRFDEGLAVVNRVLDPSLLEGLRQGTQGSEKLVTRGAEMAEKVADYTYPASITFDGLTPRVRYRRFWPEGTEIGAQMRQVATGVQTTNGAIERLAGELPRIQGVVNESRKSIGVTRRALGLAIARQQVIERLLAESPARAARISDGLPRLTADLAKALRSTADLNNVAGALRQSRTGIDTAIASWPQLRGGLTGAASLLRTTRDQMDQLIGRRAEYEAAQTQIGRVSAEFGELLPAFTERLSARLEQEDRVLAEMERGTGQATQLLTTFSEVASRWLDSVRIVAWLIALLVCVHAVYRIGDPWFSRRYREHHRGGTACRVPAT